MEKDYILSKIPFALMVLALFGIIDASYLTAEHFLGQGVKCLLVSGCDTVLTSSYSTIFGVPIAVGGLIFYLGVLGLAYFFYETKEKRILKYLLIWSILGIIFTGWLLYIQAFILEAFCFYCLVSAFFVILIFSLSIFEFKNS